MKTIPEHPLSIKREAFDLHNKLKPLLEDAYIETTQTTIDFIEEVAYLNYVKDTDIRLFD